MPSEVSWVTSIWLFAVTALVLTVTVVAAAAMTTDPFEALAHTAGAADEEQFEAEPRLADEIEPVVVIG